MNVGLAQIDPGWKNRDVAKEHISALFERDVTIASLDWVILPEMTLSGFSMDLTATTLEKNDFDFFSQLARHYQIALTYGGVVDGRNCCLTLDTEGKQIACYEKIHLFSYVKEDQYYTAGTKQVSFELDSFQITPFICYDLRFANLFWQAGPTTDVFVVIANWPASRIEHWITLLRARAIENQCFVIGVNRVGHDPNVSYVGGSEVFSPTGESVLELPNKAGIFQVEVSKKTVIETRQNFPMNRTDD